MDSDDCEIGSRVKINMPGNDLVHEATGTVIDRQGFDEATIRLDVIKPEYAAYDDLRTGLVTLDIAVLEQQPADK